MSPSHDILIQSNEGRRDKEGKWMTLRMFLACWTQVSLSILLTKICYMPHLPSREAGKHIYSQRPYPLLKIRLLLLGNQKKRKKKNLLGQTRADASFSHIAHIPYSPRKSHNSSSKQSYNFIHLLYPPQNWQCLGAKLSCSYNSDVASYSVEMFF